MADTFLEQMILIVVSTRQKDGTYKIDSRELTGTACDPSAATKYEQGPHEVTEPPVVWDGSKTGDEIMAANQIELEKSIKGI